MLALLLVASKWVGLAGMLLAGVLRYFVFVPPGSITHYLIGSICTLLFSLSQAMTVFYFIGMRTAIQKATVAHNLDTALADEAVAIKKRVTGRGFATATCATAAMIAAGGALGAAISKWWHPVLALVTIALGIWTGIIEYGAFRQNAALFDRTAEAIAQAAEIPTGVETR